MARASILLTDDEAVFGETTAELLRRHGYDCDTTACGRSALEALHRRHYDVLVADIMMPGNDGLDLPRAAQALQPDLQVILVTGYPTVETAVQSLDHGVFAYKIKPFHFDDFLATVEQATRRGRLRHGLRQETVRAEALATRLRALQDVADGKTGADALNLTVRHYIREILGHASASLLDALEVLELADAAPGSNPPVRRLARHPDAEVYQEAIRETMAVLESTKGAFKSRELADLRRKLGVLMDVLGTG